MSRKEIEPGRLSKLVNQYIERCCPKWSLDMLFAHPSVADDLGWWLCKQLGWTPTNEAISQSLSAVMARRQPAVVNVTVHVTPGCLF